MNKTFKQFLAEMDDMTPSRFTALNQKTPPKQNPNDPAGAFAFVQDENEHEVNRNERGKRGSRAYDPGYQAYADAIVTHELASKNPYFPRIRAIRTNYNETTSYVVERLIHHHDLKDESDTLMALGGRMFKHFDSLIDDLSLVNHENASTKDIIGVIIEIIRHAVETENYYDIKDPLLQEALKTIVLLANENDLMFDTYMAVI